ncbi:MAG: M28 family peptidase [Gemmatimonadota bacterium]
MSTPSARAVLDQLLALPREAGTPAAEEARRLLAARLTSLGYHVSVEPFAFATAPLESLRLAGAGVLTFTLAALPLLAFPGAPAGAALAVWLGGLLMSGAATWGVGFGMVTLGRPPRTDANLVARRGDARVTRWLVAHVDTKAQGHSMAGRLVAVWVLLLAIGMMTAAAIGRWGLARPLPPAALAGCAALAVAAAGLTARGRLRGTSPGARDNGSGLLAVLVAAETAPPTTGILLTGAEEFGLAGASAFVAQHRDELTGADVVNVDTLDDAGTLVIVAHDRRGRALAGRELARLGGLVPASRVRGLPLGILVDSLPFSRAGVPAVTVARLTWATLRRMHTPRDAAGGLEFTTATAVGRALGAAPN